jgi:hypothetical protein
MTNEQKIEYAAMPPYMEGRRGYYSKKGIEYAVIPVAADGERQCKFTREEIEERIARPNVDNWLDASQVKDMLKITEPTLRAYVDKGLLKSTKWGGVRKFHIADVKAFMGYNKLNNTKTA